MTSNTIMITIPLALTLAQFARALPGISDNEARELAQEKHDLIAAVQAAYAAHPPDKAALTKRLPAEIGGCLMRSPSPLSLATSSTLCGTPFSATGPTTQARRAV